MCAFHPYSRLCQPAVFWLLPHISTPSMLGRPFCCPSTEKGEAQQLLHRSQGVLCSGGGEGVLEKCGNRDASRSRQVSWAWKHLDRVNRICFGGLIRNHLHSDTHTHHGLQPTMVLSARNLSSPFFKALNQDAGTTSTCSLLLIYCLLLGKEVMEMQDESLFPRAVFNVSICLSKGSHKSRFFA